MTEMISSADRTLQIFLEECGECTSHHRMVQQELKCGFGLDGVCCRLCSNGPCRISKNRPYGVCGADADTIVARNFLRSVAAGSGCYIHIVENAAKRLKELAGRGGPFPGAETLRNLASLLGVSGSTECDTARQIADLILADLRRPYDEQMELIDHLAMPTRLDLWKKLNLLPGGAKDEIFNAVVKTSTNLSSDPMDMLLQCLRLGISTGLYGLRLTNLLNDIIMGESEIGFEPVGMSTIDPDCINIMNMSDEERDRLVDAEWQLPDGEKSGNTYGVEVSIYAEDRTGLLVDISRTFADRKIPVGNMSARISKQGMATLEISFYVHSSEELDTILRELKKIRSIIDVTRKVG